MSFRQAQRSADILLPPSNFPLNSQDHNDLDLAMHYVPATFSGLMTNKGWVAPNPGVPKHVRTTHSDSTEYFYIERNRVEEIQALVRFSGRKVDGNALFSLDDLQVHGNIERLRLPVVAQRSD
jgi:hypothetical protein